MIRRLFTILSIFIGFYSSALAAEDFIAAPDYSILVDGSINKIVIDNSSIIKIENENPDYLMASISVFEKSGIIDMSVYAIACKRQNYHKFTAGRSAPSDILTLLQSYRMSKVVSGTLEADVYNYVCNPSKRIEYKKFEYQ